MLHHQANNLHEHLVGKLVCLSLPSLLVLISLVLSLIESGVCSIVDMQYAVRLMQVFMLLSSKIKYFSSHRLSRSIEPIFLVRLKLQKIKILFPLCHQLYSCVMLDDRSMVKMSGCPVFTLTPVPAHTGLRHRI